MNKFIAPLFICLILLVCSCAKENSNPTPGNPSNPDTTADPLKRTDTITAGRWKLTTFINIQTYQDGTVDTVDFVTPYPYSADNIYTFNPDSTVTKDEGPTKLNSSDPQISVSGTWELDAGGTKFYDGNVLGAWTDIVQFDSTIMKLDFPIIVSGTHHHHILVYTHVN